MLQAHDGRRPGIAPRPLRYRHTPVDSAVGGIIWRDLGGIVSRGIDARRTNVVHYIRARAVIADASPIAFIRSGYLGWRDTTTGWGQISAGLSKQRTRSPIASTNGRGGAHADPFSRTSNPKRANDRAKSLSHTRTPGEPPPGCRRLWSHDLVALRQCVTRSKYWQVAIGQGHRTPLSSARRSPRGKSSRLRSIGSSQHCIPARTCPLSADHRSSTVETLRVCWMPGSRNNAAR